MSPRPDRSRAAALLAVVLTAVPVAVAGVRAAMGPWVPAGDEAYFTLRSLDVGTAHHPLLGAWSAGSLDVERNVNNLGPLQLDLLAPFTQVAPMGGTAIGVAFLHVVSVVTIAWLVRRTGGWASVPPAMVAVAGLAWVLGSEMLITPRQHQFLLLPYLVVLVAAWAATAGDRWAMVPFVVAGSLVTQTHLSYPLLVGALAVPVLVGQVLAVRRDDGVDRRRPWIVATVVGAVLWAQPAIDQFAGMGNLGDVFASSGESATPPFGDAVQVVAGGLVSTVGYLRPGYADFEPADLADPWQVLTLAALVVGLVVACVLAARAGRRTVAGGTAVAVVAVVAAVVDATQLPVTLFGLRAENYRWLWPTSTLFAIGALVGLARVGGERLRPAVTSVTLVGVAVLCALNLPTSYQVPNPEIYRDHLESTATLTTELAAADLSMIDGPVVIDQRRMYFTHPYAYPVALVLREQGLDYRLEGEGQARRFGDHRVADGTEPYRLVLIHGSDALAAIGDPATVAHAEGPAAVAIVLVSDG